MERPKREGYTFDVRDTSPFVNYGKGVFDEIKVKNGAGQGTAQAQPIMFNVVSIGDTTDDNKKVTWSDLPFGGMRDCTPIQVSNPVSDIMKPIDDLNKGIFDDVYFATPENDDSQSEIYYAELCKKFMGGGTVEDPYYVPIYKIDNDTFYTYILPYGEVIGAWNEVKTYDPAFPVCRPGSDGYFDANTKSMEATAPVIEAQVADDCEYSRLTINVPYAEPLRDVQRYFLHRHKTYSHGSATHESYLYLTANDVDQVSFSLGLEEHWDEITIDFEQKTIRVVPIEIKAGTSYTLKSGNE